MDRLIKWWGGYILVELSGDTPERLINLCGYNGIDVWDLVWEEGKYRFYVRRQDFKQLVAFVRKSRNRMVVLEKQGLPFGIRRHRHRKWFAAGIPVALILMYVMSLHIWEIVFDGNSYFTDELLRKTLTMEGYDIGMRKSQVICEDLEMRLREIYPEITWVSAQISGTKLSIQIRENTGILTVEESDEIPCDLVASEAGVITSIITRSGTPMVKPGDEVKEGQILVRGVVELYNDSKEKVGEHLVEADADVLAQRQIIYEDHFAVEYPVKWYTGEKRYSLTVTLFGRQILMDLSGMKDNRSKKLSVESSKEEETQSVFISKLIEKIPSLKKIPWLYHLTYYDTVTVEREWYLTKDIVLPVSWQLTTMREYEESHAIYSQTQAISRAEKKYAGFFENLLEKGVQIIEKNVRIDMIGGECVAEGTVTVIGPIGQLVPITQNMGHQEESSN